MKQKLITPEIIGHILYEMVANLDFRPTVATNIIENNIKHKYTIANDATHAKQILSESYGINDPPEDKIIDLEKFSVSVLNQSHSYIATISTIETKHIDIAIVHCITTTL